MQRFSPTQLGQFSDCRRAWLWGKDLYPKEPQLPLWFGVGIHQGLEYYYKRGRDGSVAISSFKRWRTSSMTRLSKTLKFYWQMVEPQFVEAGHTMEGVLQNYFEYDQSDRPPLLQGEIIEVEKMMAIPILSGVTLTGKIDLILKHDRGGLIIVDHKTSSRGISDDAVSLDDQITAYAYLVWRGYGEIPKFLVFNEIKKNVPSPPSKLSRGGLSIARDQPTTYAMYMAALEEEGIDPSDDRYTLYLEYLKNHGYEIFFRQIPTTRNISELESFELRTKAKIREMQRALRDPDVWAYPSPSIYRCGYCPFLNPCKSKDDGGDYQAILDARFTDEWLY